MARLTKKKYAVLAGVSAVALTAGAAFAYWTTTGEDTGTATTGTSTPWTVTITDTNNANLAPTTATGLPVQTVSFSVKNDGSGVQSFSSAVPTVVSTDKAGCAASNYATSNTSITTGSVNAGATVNGTFELRLVDDGADQNACKDAQVTVKVAVS
ncbi:hypothetical protein [Marmoricola sp. RAF53]|uniref:hypothetical protein n=1 Tax=Marmoricola sp. RAF53 TaxID=3233059 RepID=UPI003F988807